MENELHSGLTKAVTIGAEKVSLIKQAYKHKKSLAHNLPKGQQHQSTGHFDNIQKEHLQVSVLSSKQCLARARPTVIEQTVSVRVNNVPQRHERTAFSSPTSLLVFQTYDPVKWPNDFFFFCCWKKRKKSFFCLTEQNHTHTHWQLDDGLQHNRLIHSLHAEVGSSCSVFCVTQPTFCIYSLPYLHIYLFLFMAKTWQFSFSLVSFFLSLGWCRDGKKSSRLYVPPI